MFQNTSYSLLWMDVADKDCVGSVFSVFQDTDYTPMQTTFAKLRGIGWRSALLAKRNEAEAAVRQGGQRRGLGSGRGHFRLGGEGAGQGILGAHWR